MAIVAADIKMRLSTQAGAAGNAGAGTPGASIGKYMSTTDITDNVLDNLLRDITAAEDEAGITVYRCFFVYNSHASLTYKAAKVWIASQQAGGADITMGLDPGGVVTYNQAGAQATAPANELTAPASVAFTAPTTEGTALVIGDMAINKCAAVWVKAVVAPGAAAIADQMVITVKGNTDP